MNFSKKTFRVLLSFSLLCSFYFTANVLTEADYLEAQKMKNGEEISLEKSNKRVILNGLPKKVDTETKKIGVKYRKKDLNEYIKNDIQRQSENYDYKFKPRYDTKYLPFESQGNDTRNCADCVYDFTNYGSECCDSAASEFGIDCASLEANYNWDCSGCECPLDSDSNGDCLDCVSGCVDANTSEFCQNLDCYAATWDCIACTQELLEAQQFCETATASQGGCAEACGNVIDPDDCEDEEISGNVNGFVYESCADLVGWLSNVAGYGSSACDVMWSGSPVGIMCPETCGLCDGGGDTGCSADQFDCGNGECIPGSFECDGSNEFGNASWGPDCSNGADETLEGCCDSATYANVSECGGGEDPQCADDQFDCYGDGTECISGGWYCDGSNEFGNASWGPDCSNGADEILEACCSGGYYDASVCGGGGDTCADQWSACVDSLEGTEYYEACSAEDCEGGVGGACDGAVVPGLTDACGEAANNIINGSCPDPCGSSGGDTCEDGQVQDCVDADCAALSWVGDGWCDGTDQAFGMDLCCYDLDGGDCTEAECSAPSCGDGACNGDEDYYTCPDDCAAPGTCEEGQVEDCVDDDCATETWIGDGWCDGTAQQFGMDLCCYDLDGGDCTEAECAEPSCGDGACNGDEDEASCAEDCAPSTECDDCEFDFTNYGSECCDTAAADFGIDCATLEANYFWDCSGCECPLDTGEPATCEELGLWDCGDGQCINPAWVCDGSDEFGNASWPADCANGADEGLEECCDTAAYQDLEECGGDGGGDDLPRPGDNCTGDPDEYVCPSFDFFGYVSGGECVPADQVCDGIIDCYYYDGPFSGVHDETAAAGCDDGGGGSPECSDCEFDFTNYGSECCDTAAVEFGIDCATLEANYSWDCSGCECPLDTGEPATCEELGLWDCGDGQCINPNWVCDGSSEFGNASWPADCANGADEGLEECCDAPAYADVAECDAGSDTCDDESACNFGAEAVCEYPDAGYNCDGSIADGYHIDCAGTVLSDSFLSWIGDGYCDDGSFGADYLCCEYNYDNGDCGGSDGLGDLNGDCVVNVIDVITLVNAVVNSEDLPGGDINGDGGLNVIDVVALVNIILGEGRVSDATSADMMITDNSLSLTSNGYIGGVQMTLSHDNGFELNLTDKAMVAEYKTSGTSTILVVVEPNDELIFTTNQSFDIVEMIVANSSEEIEVNTISEFGLSSAYPNPFNPSTSVTLTVPSADYISVKVYNLMGQMVGTLADGMMEANVYTFTWDASDVSSGVYLIKAESSSSVDIQKVLLVK